MKCIIILLLVMGLFLPLPARLSAQNGPPVFSTGETLELDRVASAWLIKRYVAPGAEFRFFPDGQLIVEGTAFDTPDASLQRNHNLSTFEVIQNRYGIADPKLAELTAIIHENEINFWAGAKNQQVSSLVSQMNRIIKESKDNQTCLQQCFSLLDQFVDGK